LGAALDLEGFLGRDAGEFEVVGAVGRDVGDAGHGLDRQGHEMVMMVRRRLVPRKHSMNVELSVSLRAAAAAVTLMMARCFSAESSEWPRRRSAREASSSRPLLTSHHGDLGGGEVSGGEVRREGSEYSLWHKWCNKNGGDAEAPLCDKEATVGPFGGLGSERVGDEDADEWTDAEGYIAQPRHQAP
jgi:hypothetical protein